MVRRLPFGLPSGLVRQATLGAGLYARLHVSALPQLRTLTSYVDRWDVELAEMAKEAPMSRRLVEQAVSLAESFVEDDASTGSSSTVTCTTRTSWRPTGSRGR